MLKQRRNETKLSTAIREYCNRTGTTTEHFAQMVADTHWQCRKTVKTHVFKWLAGSMPSVYAFIGIAQIIGCKNVYELMDDCEPGSDTIR